MERSRKYNIELLSGHLRACGEEISTLKKQMRRSRYLPTLQEYRELSRLKKRATMLCCLRAHHRGKTHLLSDIGKNIKMVQEHEGEYLASQETVAA